ncbi:hypothetical protein J2Z40_000447 [Cytobacillus eiseniae]|uniref:RsgI N-terminal anti-sigma domain-containing protein n=1 Tax=Cytobacillus eiseniae TaxID=762947 RepID=A0ABS4RC32_9BACI|nr:anti-sigma factor domain-containing protein [Cytobacillus eiseniae]MBP2239894.1 hypothetical protein [Cytobacillus eiseniae]
MKTGIIMEVDDRFLTVLTPEGEFLRANNHHNQFQIGEEIEFIPIELDNPKKSFSSLFTMNMKWKAALSVAIMLLIAFVVVSPLSSNNKVYAYLSIDVNPSIEIGINEQFEVIEISSFNDEGEQIINQLNGWKKKNIHVLTNDILQEMKVQGYIKDSQEIIIATVYKEAQSKKDPRLEQELNEVKNIINQENLELKMVEGSSEERVKAKEEGLTIGIYKEQKQIQTQKSVPKEKENLIVNEQKSELKDTEKRNSTQNDVKKSPSQQKRNPATRVEKDLNREDKNELKKIPSAQEKKKIDRERPHNHEKKNENRENHIKKDQKQDDRWKQRKNDGKDQKQYHKERTTQKHKEGRENKQKQKNDKNNGQKHRDNRHKQNEQKR